MAALKLRFLSLVWNLKRLGFHFVIARLEKVKLWQSKIWIASATPRNDKYGVRYCESFKNF